MNSLMLEMEISTEILEQMDWLRFRMFCLIVKIIHYFNKTGMKVMNGRKILNIGIVFKRLSEYQA